MATTTSWLQLIAAGIILCLVQCLAAIPWIGLITADASLYRVNLLRRLLPRAIGGAIVAGLLTALVLKFEEDREFLSLVGRVYAAVLYFQLVLDFFVLVFGILLLVWPRGATVAMAAFREGVRQPMFWLLIVLATVFLCIMPFVPYFTFGEDVKMVKEIGYDVIMLFTALFAVLMASISISEEIEGRTAITLMSKPVSRRQFLLGKFVGILMAALLMCGTLSLVYLLVVWGKTIYEKEQIVPPLGLYTQLLHWEGTLGTVPMYLLGGILWWFYEAVAASPGLILGFCQVMVLLSIAVALATRLPMVVNLVICLVVYFVGHLTPVLATASRGRFPLVGFIAQLFDTIFPGLDLFNIGSALTRDTLPPAGDFALYVGSVSAYALLYTTIALLFGLILFEDRDLA